MTLIPPLTLEQLDRIEATRRDTAPLSNGHVRAPPEPKAEPKGYYTKVPNWLFESAADKDLDASSTVVLFQIVRLTIGMHSPTLSVVISTKRLAARCNFSPATCNRAMKRLEQAGLIRRENRAGNNGEHGPNALHLMGTD